MYPESIFPPALFPGSLFPPSTTAEATSADLVDALVAYLQAQLVATGQLTWFGSSESPGWQDAPLPYAVLEEPDEDDSWWTTDADQLADGHLQVQCFAGTKSQSKALGGAVAALLNDAPLQFQDVTLVYLRQSSRMNAKDPDEAPGGGDCWAETRLFHFMVSS